MRANVPVPGAAGRDVALDREQRLVGVGARERAEHVGHAPEQPAAQFERRDRVVEAGRGLIGRDRRYLGIVVREGAVEGRRKVRGRDAPERRGAERTGPFLKERIVGGSGRGGGFIGLVHAAGPG
jgi:hypothetical protein